MDPSAVSYFACSHANIYLQLNFSNFDKYLSSIICHQWLRKWFPLSWLITNLLSFFNKNLPNYFYKNSQFRLYLIKLSQLTEFDLINQAPMVSSFQALPGAKFLASYSSRFLRNRPHKKDSLSRMCGKYCRSWHQIMQIQSSIFKTTFFLVQAYNRSHEARTVLRQSHFDLLYNIDLGSILPLEICLGKIAYKSGWWLW